MSSRRYRLSIGASSLLLTILFLSASIGPSKGYSVPEPTLLASPAGEGNAYYPQSFVGEAEFTFRVLPGFSRPEFKHYVTLHPRADSELEILDENGTVIESISELQGLGITTQLDIDKSGNYTVRVMGEGAVAVAAMPRGWDQSGSYEGPFPPGWFALLLPSWMWAGHANLNISFEFGLPAVIALFALHDDMELVREIVETRSGQFELTPSPLVLFYFLAILNPESDSIEGSVRVISYTPRRPIDPIVTLALLIGVGISLVILTLFRVRKRERGN